MSVSKISLSILMTSWADRRRASSGQTDPVRGTQEDLKVSPVPDLDLMELETPSGQTEAAQVLFTEPFGPVVLTSTTSALR